MQPTGFSTPSQREVRVEMSPDVDTGELTGNGAVAQAKLVPITVFSPLGGGEVPAERRALCSRGPQLTPA